VRPQADYRQSLDVLGFARRHADGLLGGVSTGAPTGVPSVMLTKSGFMVGLGETPDEVRALLSDLRAAGTDVATIGQYLQPTRRNLPVAEFVEPRQFEAYREYGLAQGFKAVFSGPLVRSSYMADLLSQEARREPC
jgi:lipoic acid synthetase